MKFDGKALALRKEEELRKRVGKFKRRPKLVIFLVGREEGSIRYVELKKQLGERIGMEIEVRGEQMTLEELVGEIKEVGEDKEVDGVMVQLPIGDLNREETRK